MIEALLKAGANPGGADQKPYWTPLHFAAANNENPAVIEALLKAGADLEALTKRPTGLPCILHPQVQRRIRR